MSEIIEGDFAESTAVTVRDAPPVALTGIAAGFHGIDLSRPEGLEKALTLARSALTLQTEVLKMVVQLTTESDWDELGGKPALSAAACERTLSALGARVEIVDEVWEWDEHVWDPDAQQLVPNKKGDFGCKMRVRIEHPILGIRDGVGLAHSTDQFLGTKGGAKAKAIEEGASPDIKGRLVSEVSRHNIYQHAYTRAKAAATRKAIGASGRTWDSLRTSYGLAQGTGNRVDYGSKGEPAARKTESGPPKTRKLQNDGAGPDRAKLRSQVAAAAKNKGVAWGALSEWAAKNAGFKGDKILDAPAEVLKVVLDALDSGKITGKA